jgi:hypothetical protein
MHGFILPTVVGTIPSVDSAYGVTPDASPRIWLIGATPKGGERHLAHERQMTVLEVGTPDNPRTARNLDSSLTTSMNQSDRSRSYLYSTARRTEAIL